MKRFNLSARLFGRRLVANAPKTETNAKNRASNAPKTVSKHLLRFALPVLAAFVPGGGMGAYAQTLIPIPPPTISPTRVVTHPDWGGETAAQYLAAQQINYQYPPENLAVDNTYDNLLTGAWSEDPPDWASMDPVPEPTDPTTAPTPPQYLFTISRTIVVGTTDTLTAKLTIAPSPTVNATTLQVVSAELIGSTAYDGMTVATVPYSCSGATCTFTWTNPSTAAQFWGPLTIKATVTSNGYPGTWVVYKDFYSSPVMAGRFTGQFTDKIVNGSLVINAGVTVYPISNANQQMSCTMSGNLYSVDWGWPLQHFEKTMLVDPSTTSIPFTFFGKIFTDYGDAGTFSLQDLKAQCLALAYPAAWDMDPVTHLADLQTWAANNPTGPDQPPYIYFGKNNFSYNTASYANSVFSSAPYQTPQQTAALQPELVAFANAEAAGAALDTAFTDAAGNITYTNAAGGTTYLLYIHGRHDPNTCPSSQGEAYGTFTEDKCGLWKNPPKTAATKLFVQWDAWNSNFDKRDKPGGNWEINVAIAKYCQRADHNVCHFICHSAGCAALESVLAGLHDRHVFDKFFIANVIAATSAAGGSELANAGKGLPTNSTSTAHDTAKIDRSLTTIYARTHYDHDHMGVPIRAIAGTQLDGAFRFLSPFFKSANTGSATNLSCFTIPLTHTFVCADDVVSLHSSCGHRHFAFYQDCNTMLNASVSKDTKGTFNWHGWWIDDKENPGGGTITGPFSDQGKADRDSCNNTADGFCHSFHVDHFNAPQLAVDEYTACHTKGGHPYLCP